MFGIQLEIDEWLAVGGAAILVLRLLYGFARVAWCFITDTPFFSPQMVVGFNKHLLILIPAMTCIALAMLTIGMASIASDKPGKNAREVVYPGGAFVGVVLGMVLELVITILSIKLLFWLARFRLPRYREQLQSGNPEERVAAAKGLARLGKYARPASNEMLLALHDQSADVRAACAQAILFANQQSPSAEDRDTSSAARAALKDPDCRCAAAAAILVHFQAVTSRDVLPALIEGLMHENDETAIVAIIGLDRLGPDAAPACPALRDAILKSQNQTPQFPLMQSSIGIFQAVGAPAVPVLIEILDKGEQNTKWSAAEALGKIGEPAREALPLLRKLARGTPTMNFAYKKAIRKIDCKKA